MAYHKISINFGTQFPMSTESQTEQSFIKKLIDLKYTYRSDIRDRNSLEKNFREKFEALNRVRLSDAEFSRLRDEIVNPDVFKASKLLREQQYFQREDGTPLHYTLVNNRDWCKNEFEVINQLRMNTENSNHRYDVIILINGVPVVQIELKTLDISPRKAMQQIINYKYDAGNGYTNSFMCFMQLFIVSNNSNTYYFANNKIQHFQFNADEQFLPVYKFADIDNKPISGLPEFTEKFLSKCTLGEMISKYMVLVESEQKLLVMRPYQIYAVKAIVNCIEQNRGNGYIWHTTGSGKTLTSFKASTLLKNNNDIEKCLFVVDRKDLDRQTREEFNRFQDGSVEENTNTETLVRRLLSKDYADKVIVTTIQKLGLALDGGNKNNYKERLEPLRNKRIVFIFDECHRSQFGDNHKAIKKFFHNSQLFGFTGTPIFDENATYKKVNGEIASYQTTKDIFQQELHNYTISHAIEDRNVLRFHIDYFKGQGNTNPKPGEPIAQQAVAEAILEKHDNATNYRKFNALFATATINDAIAYYQLFKQLQQQMLALHEDYIPLNIACVFSPPAQALAAGDQKNVADIRQLQEDLEQEKADNQVNPEEKKKALMAIIADYNNQYGTNHTINEFDSYYQDVQSRIKNQKYSNKEVPHKDKIDIVIVVDMLLTGFDSKFLNTLYVDKNLKYHGLIQAFSRTNRVLNDTKPYGNILDFRSQQEQVDQAIVRFSDNREVNAREIWLVDPAPVIIEKYQKAVQALGIFMNSQNLVNEPQEVYKINGDTARVNFVKNFKEVQKLRTQLNQYTDLNDEQKALIETLLPEDKLRSFRSSYLETAKQLKDLQEKAGEDAPPEIQQLDFEFVLFASALIDYDYIMGLIADNTDPKSKKQKMTKEQVIQLLGSSANLMDDKEDLTEFINGLDWSQGQDEQQLKQGYELFKVEKNAAELSKIAKTHGLETYALKTFVDDIMYRMVFDGEKLTDLLAPFELGWKDRRVKELALMEDLVKLLHKQAQDNKIAGLEAYE